MRGRHLIFTHERNRSYRLVIVLSDCNGGGGGGGGGGGDMRIFENSQRKWPNFNTQKLFLSNGKIVYYQDILQLPVPLNTLHTIHLNAKSHNLL